MALLNSSKNTNTDLPEAFLQAFPIQLPPAPATLVTVAEFDAWAVEHGLYRDVNIADRAALNSGRSQLRYKINNVTMGQMWRDTGAPIFQIEVHEHGATYVVKPAVVGFVDQGTALPRKIKRVARTRAAQLDRLMQAAEFGGLPLELQIEVRTCRRDIAKWQERAIVDLNQMEQGFVDLRDDIKKYYKPAALLIENGESDDEDDDGYQNPLL